MIEMTGSPEEHNRQTRDIEAMLALCSASVADDVPTLNRHWLNDPCLLGIILLHAGKRHNVVIHLANIYSCVE